MARACRLILLTLIMTAGLFAAFRRGIPPRSDVSTYAAWQSWDALAIGVNLLTESDTQRLFAAELNHSFLVVEIALYPAENKPLVVSLNDFAITALGGSGSIAAMDPGSAVSILCQGDKPGRKIQVTSSTSRKDYEAGEYDPITGRQKVGEHVTSNVDVSLGKNTNHPGKHLDREAIERELTEKSLAEGLIRKPISGFLYFPLPAKQTNTAYQLEYSWKGQKLILGLKPNKQ